MTFYLLSVYSMDKNNICKKYTDRSINEVYSKLLCQFSDVNEIQGKNGKKGTTGTKGDSGNIGNIGNYGDKGFLGNVGSDGEKGNFGDEGNKGLIGSEGNKGENASNGDLGSNGDSGSNGIKGEMFNGDKGENGSNGNTGLNGNKGNAGSNKNFGSDGDRGNIGSEGNFGLSGDFGLTGTTGETIEGSTGDFGNIGNNGTKGDQGNQGNKGDFGSNGETGNLNVCMGYAFGQNTNSTVTVMTDPTAGGIPYPTAFSGGYMSVIQSTASTVFISMSPTEGIFLITYDIKTVNASQTTIIFLLAGETSTGTIPGTVIQPPTSYDPGKFISFNRTCLAKFGAVILKMTDTNQSTITLEGGINGPQISFIQIA